MLADASSLELSSARTMDLALSPSSTSTTPVSITIGIRLLAFDSTVLSHVSPLSSVVALSTESPCGCISPLLLPEVVQHSEFLLAVVVNPPAYPLGITKRTPQGRVESFLLE